MPSRNRDTVAPPGSGSTSVVRGQTCAYVIESSNKVLIDSIYGLFLKYSDSNSDERLDFTMTLAKLDDDGNSGNSGSSDDARHAIHVSGSLNREKTRRSIVTCTTLGDYMADQTVGMPNDRLARMLELLHEQMRELQGGVPSYHGVPSYYGTPYYGLDDILIINEAFFCFFNDDKLFALDPDTRRMDVTRPISRDHAFYAPELKGRLHALPYEVDYSASLYSLGLLTAFCALLKWDLVSTDAKKGGAWRTYSDSELVKMLDPIKYSKLYWFVLRCCRSDASRRLCVFV